jgi:hypothetical protein
VKQMPRSVSKNRSRVCRSSIAILIAVLLAVAPRAQRIAPEQVPAKQTPQDLVDALRDAFGEHHARAVHAKGILLQGTFTPAQTARALSRESLAWRTTQTWISKRCFCLARCTRGIEPADPMLTLRNDAYPISFKKRQ